MTEASIIRPALPRDAAAIAALTRKAYTLWIALTGREPLPMRVNYAAAMQAHDFALIGSVPDLIGLIETTPEAGALLIVNIAVEPASQGRGLSRQLMAYAEDLGDYIHQTTSSKSGLRSLPLWLWFRGRLCRCWFGGKQLPQHVVEGGFFLFVFEKIGFGG